MADLALPPLPPGAVLDEAAGLPPLPMGAKLDGTSALPPLPPGAKLDNPTWQDAVKPVKLPNGISTVIRPDGYVWLDETKVAPGEKNTHGKPGWKTPDLWGGWKSGPDAPKDWKPTNDPKEMGDAQIATQLLGMTPEQYLQMSTAGTYKPGDMQNLLKMEAPAENATIRDIVAPARSIMLGAKKSAQDITSLAMKPLSWMGSPAAELWSNAQSKLLQVAQNQSQSRAALEGGIDPLHMAGGFALGRGPNVTTATEQTAATLAGQGRQIALEEAATKAGRETPSLWNTAKDIYRASLPESVRSSGVVAATTPGSVADRTQAGLAAGIAQPLIETGLQAGLYPGIAALFNFGKSFFQKDLAPLPGRAGQLNEAFKTHGIDPLASDLVDDPSSKIVSLAEHSTASPVASLGPKNVAEQVQATRAVRNFQKQLMVKVKALGYDNIEALTAAAEAEGPASQAGKLLKLANDAGNDLPKIIAVNGNINRWQAQQVSNKKYGAAIASDTGAVGGPEHLKPLIDEADALLAEQAKLGAQADKKLVAYLKEVKRDVTAAGPIPEAPPAGTKPTISFNPETKEFTNETAKAATAAEEALAAKSGFEPTVTGLERYRKGIQDKRIAALKGEDELTGNMATNALQRLRNATDQAQLNVAELSPGTLTKLKEARANYTETIVPYKKRALINLLGSETPDVAANRMMNMTEDQLAQIVPELGEKGKAAARLLKIQRAVEFATDRTNPNPDHQFMPIEFAKKMKDPKFMEFLGLTAPKGGEDKWALDGLEGLVEVMHHMRTAGQVSKAGHELTRTTAWVSAPAAAMKWLLTTKAGKQLLLQASDLKAGSPQFATLIERMDKALSTKAVEVGKVVAPEAFPEEKQ